MLLMMPMLMLMMRMMRMLVFVVCVVASLFSSSSSFVSLSCVSFSCVSFSHKQEWTHTHTDNTDRHTDNTGRQAACFSPHTPFPVCVSWMDAHASLALRRRITRAIGSYITLGNDGAKN